MKSNKQILISVHCNYYEIIYCETSVISVSIFDIKAVLRIIFLLLHVTWGLIFAVKSRSVLLSHASLLTSSKSLQRDQSVHVFVGNSTDGVARTFFCILHAVNNKVLVHIVLAEKWQKLTFKG